MKTKTPKPPDHLKFNDRKFWRGVLRDYEITEHHDLKLLAEACSCIDRIDEARQEIEKVGSYYIDRFGQPKEHPGQRTERDNKILLARLLRELCLDIEPPASRPPGLY
jgi:P27 family predicted phage terminase small subunit